MTEHSPPLPQPVSRTAAGILCIEAGMVFFVVQDAMMKVLLAEYTVWTLIAARGAAAVLVLVPVIAMLGAPHRLLTPLWPLHLARAGLFAVGFSMFYTAFPFMGLAEVTTIFFAAPLVTALFAALFLGERIGAHRTACLVLGFTGVAIAMNPGGGTFQPVAVLPLMCAVTYALSQVIARRIGERETTLTLGLYTIAFAGLMIVPIGHAVDRVVAPGPELAHIRWAWPALDAGTAGTLLLLGTIGMAGYMLTSRAYQIASASVIAPFDYTYLPLAVVVGYVLWGEVPGPHTLLGMALIVGSGLYLGYRELRHRPAAEPPAPTAEVTFVPGAPAGAIVHASDTARAAGEDGPRP